MRARLVVAAAFAVALAAPAPAQAGDPIMPLDQLRRGMKCTGYSVVQGTAISSFDVEVMDILGPAPGQDGPRILVRVSGEAIDATGIGPGFSGSPFYCRDEQGTARNAGAISESIGSFGGKTALATPIEEVLGEPPDAPEGARNGTAARRAARSLAAPLTISGVSPSLGRAITSAAHRLGRTVLAGPTAPLTPFPVQELRPGSAMAVGLSSGDLAIGAVGTVAYTDADRVWGFGHPFDAAGRRNLFIQDAYVYEVVNNPAGVEGAATYKLATPGHDLGVLTNDALDAVVGRIGPLPERTALRVLARDLDTNRVSLLESQVADENPIDLPFGASPLGLVGGTGVAQAASTILKSSPARQSGSMCVKVRIRERPRPMGFCNRYVGDSTDLGGNDASPVGVIQARMLDDFSRAVELLDAYKASVLHVTGITASIKVRRGLEQAYMTSARIPKAVRRGRRLRVRLRARRVRGPEVGFSFSMKVPRKLRPGRHFLQLTGTPTDEPEGNFATLLGSLFTDTIDFGVGGPDGGQFGPANPDELALAVKRLQAYDGIRGKLVDPRKENDADDPDPEDLDPGRKTYRHPRLRISGNLRLPIRIRR